MNKVKLITDSTCDILDESGINALDKLGIDFVCLNVSFDDKTYKDGLEITPQKVFEIEDEKHVLPKTSSPSVGLFEEKFKKYIDEGYDIVYFGLGSGFSSTYQNACTAADDLLNKRIFVVDSELLSSAIGLLLYKAAKLVEEGKSAKEIVEYLESHKKKVRISFIIDTLKYLHKGGRCSALSFYVGSALQLKPIIAVDDNKMVVKNKCIGRRMAVKSIVRNFMEDYEQGLVDMDKIFITDGFGPNLREDILNQLIEQGFKKEQFSVSSANCTVCVHCGPETCGIIYLLK